MVPALGFGLRTSRRRLVTPSTLVTVVFTLAVVALVALVQANDHPLRAPTRTLHATFGVVLPLFSFVLIRQATGRERLGRGAWAVARFGWPRRWIVGGEVLVPTVLSVAVWTLATGLALPLAYGGHAGLAVDLRASLPVAALAGLTYAVWFAAGATFLRRGSGIWGALGGDAVLGGGAGILAIPWPRSHVASLLGAPLVMDWSPRVSSLTLLLICAIGGGTIAHRAGR